MPALAVAVMPPGVRRRNVKPAERDVALWCGRLRPFFSGTMDLDKALLWLGRAALVGCVLLTAWGAFAPGDAARPHLFPWDKAEHFSAYFALTACALVAFPRAPLAWLGGLLSASGAAVELIQALPFINRDCDIKDWVADTLAVGAVLGVVMAARLRRKLA